MHMLVKGISN